jgi:hypothetical protein
MNTTLELTLSAIAVIAVIGVGAASPATADPMPPNCVNDPIGIFKVKQRLICDMQTRPDGSWSRERVFWLPAHQVPSTTTCSGEYSVTCSTYDGYWADDTIVDDQTYVVYRQRAGRRARPSRLRQI